MSLSFAPDGPQAGARTAPMMMIRQWSGVESAVEWRVQWCGECSGVVWCGVVWSGVEWSGECSGVVWCGVGRRLTCSAAALPRLRLADGHDLQRQRQRREGAARRQKRIYLSIFLSHGRTGLG